MLESWKQHDPCLWHLFTDVRRYWNWRDGPLSMKFCCICNSEASNRFGNFILEQSFICAYHWTEYHLEISFLYCLCTSSFNLSSKFHHPFSLPSLSPYHTSVSLFQCLCFLVVWIRFMHFFIFLSFFIPLFFLTDLSFFNFSILTSFFLFLFFYIKVFIWYFVSWFHLSLPASFSFHVGLCIFSLYPVFSFLFIQLMFHFSNLQFISSHFVTVTSFLFSFFLTLWFSFSIYCTDPPLVGCFSFLK